MMASVESLDSNEVDATLDKPSLKPMSETTLPAVVPLESCMTTCSSSAVKVAVRIRPLTANELLQDATECVSPAALDPCSIVIGSNVTVYGQPAQQKAFTFDYVLDKTSSQELLFSECASPLLEKFIQGYNATIFAYGQTGSGKTYSMGTGMEIGSSDAERGMVPRVIESIFLHLKECQTKNPKGFKYHMFVSFLELYNEDWVDLLNSKRGGSGLSIREDGQGHIVWSGVREEPVFDQRDVLGCLQKGSLCRTTGSTDMNACSSRSHAIFSITLQKEKWIGASAMDETEPDSTQVCDPESHPEGSWQLMTSKFHFVDLAGSERLKRTNAHGDRKKEGISINQGLLALGNVISALGDEARKATHIPYRDSKLTRLLQDSLGGNSQTLMLACISPSNTNYGETLNTLQYANRAKNIKNKVSLNYQMLGGGPSGEVSALRQLVGKLQNEVAALRSRGASAVQSDHFRQAELDDQVLQLNRQLNSKTFEVEKLSFFNYKLQTRCKELVKELSHVTSQLNTGLLETCLLKKKLQSAIESDEEESLASNQVVLIGQQKMIADLRLELYETQDKLGWYKNVFGKLGKKENKSHSVPTSRATSPCHGPTMEVLQDLEMKPRNPRLNSLLDGNELELLHERNFIKVLKTDPELQKALQTCDAKAPACEVDATLPKFYGIPAHVSTPFKASPLTHPPIIANLDKQSTESSDPEEQGEPVVDDDGDDEFEDEEKAHSRSSSIYLLVDKIQSDIAEHETIVDRLQKSEAEYEAMKQAFEQKLTLLQHQMGQIKKERDLALDKVQQGITQPKEKAGTMAIKIRYDKQQKKLESEISDLRKKLSMRTSSKSQNQVLIKTLKATIQSLKAEKMAMTRKLKMEAEKSRWFAVSKEKEVSLLKRKERQIAEAVKNLERHNQMQKILKRRSIEFGSNDKLKNVLSILKRTSSHSRARSIVSRPVSAFERQRSTLSFRQRPLTAPPLQREDEDIIPPVEARAQFKKQMLEKELETCVAQRQFDFDMNELKLTQSRLIGEQKELRQEREKWVEIDKQQGVYIETKRYYMDDRLDMIQQELDSLSKRLEPMSDPTKASIFGHTERVDAGDADSWENAVNLLKSLDPSELQIVAQCYMTEAVKLRVQALDEQSKRANQEATLNDVHAVMDVIKMPLFTTFILDKLKEMSSDDHAKWIHVLERLGLQTSNSKLGEGVESRCRDPMEKSSLSLPPVIEVDEEEKDESHPSLDPAAKAAAAIKQALEAAKSGNNGEDDPNDASLKMPDVPMSNDEMRESIQRARTISMTFKGMEGDTVERKDRFTLHKSKSSHSLGESMRKSESASERLLRLLEHRKAVAPAAEQETLNDLERVKWMDMAGQTGGHLDDVFKRLAHKHTASSQAKVIQRTGNRDEVDNSANC